MFNFLRSKESIFFREIASDDPVRVVVSLMPGVDKKRMIKTGRKLFSKNYIQIKDILLLDSSLHNPDIIEDLFKNYHYSNNCIMSGKLFKKYFKKNKRKNSGHSFIVDGIRVEGDLIQDTRIAPSIYDTLLRAYILTVLEEKPLTCKYCGEDVEDKHDFYIRNNAIIHSICDHNTGIKAPTKDLYKLFCKVREYENKNQIEFLRKIQE